MRPKQISILVAAAMLSACVSVLPEPATPDALYQVDAPQKLAGLSQHLIVREPEAPRLIAGQGMVSQGTDGGLRLIPGVEWSGSATRQIQLAMIDSFKAGETGHALLPEMGVVTFFELATQLKTLGLKGETANCVMSVNVISTRDRSLKASTEVSAEIAALSGSGSDWAAALRAAASDCAGQAAAFAVDNLKPQN